MATEQGRVVPVTQLSLHLAATPRPGEHVLPGRPPAPPAPEQEEGPLPSWTGPEPAHGCPHPGTCEGPGPSGSPSFQADPQLSPSTSGG